jgi:hypothetical protein
VANVYPWVNYTTAASTSAASITYPVYTTNVIGTTWDSAAAAPRAVEWNGAILRVGAPASPAPVKDEAPTEWLRRRVEEMRVDILAEAA